MRYLVAILVSVALIAVLSIWMDQMARSLHRRMRQALITAKERGEIPADVNIDGPDFTDFGMELSASEMRTVSLLDLWYSYRVILIALIIISSLVIACKRKPAAITPPAAARPIR